MIRHIVFWRVTEAVQAAGDAPLDQAIELLRGLVGQVPGIRHLEAGRNRLPGPEASDLYLITEFDDWEALRAYQDHPAHQEVVKYLRGIRSERRVVDAELP